MHLTKIIILGISALIIGNTIWLYVKAKLNTNFVQQRASSAVENAEQSIQQALVNAVVSFGEFDRLTIPYLKEQNFEGSDIIINSQYQKNSNYNSYLATYESEGLKINGLLTIPTTKKPEGGYPAIVFIHGYIPPSAYRTTEKYVEYVDYLARNGFVVFKIDLRGHGNSEGEPGGAYYSSDYIYDALNAAAALQKHPDVNSEKIGMWGHSMAGNVTLRAAAASNKIKAAVIWAGAVYTYEDMREYGIDDNSYRPPQDVQQRNERQQSRQRMRDEYGDPSLENIFWSKVSPLNYIDENTAPIQIHHAQNDDVVSIEYTRNLKKVLNERGIEIETFEYPTGGHNLTSPSFTPAMQKTVEFYKENLR